MEDKNKNIDENMEKEEENNETKEKTEDVGAVSHASPEEKTEEVEASAASPEEKTEEEKIKEWEDKYKRLLAEFDNFRKRSEKEAREMCDIGASVVLVKMLPILDNLERAVSTIPEELKGNAFAEGIDKIYKQFLKTLEDMDVKPIEALGKAFDPNYHNAVMTDEESEAEVDTVTEELQKGYTYKNQVLRHSMVKVKK
ncbi:MAG: nucleotide exchange factor GrpE [Lachnospiraceae bacterium]|nr:nucleotide exchange factor GrpE [Lachnospiraceae bacterium]